MTAMPTYYIFDTDTKELLGTRTVATCPADGTDVVPPAVTNEQTAFWTGSAWELWRRPAIEAARVASLWKQADTITQQFDANQRARASFWLADPACPSWRRTRILAVLAWSDMVWDSYYTAKADPLITTIVPSTPPFTWAQLKAE